jgi:hypothetical protein
VSAVLFTGKQKSLLLAYIRQQQRRQLGQVVGGGVEPEVVVVGAQDHRHYAMHVGDERVGRGRDYRAGIDPVMRVLGYPSQALALPRASVH